MKHELPTITRRRLLKQGVAFGLAGAGVLSAGAMAGTLPLSAGVHAGSHTNRDAAPVYVFASDPRAAMPGFRTIPG